MIKFCRFVDILVQRLIFSYLLIFENNGRFEKILSFVHFFRFSVVLCYFQKSKSQTKRIYNGQTKLDFEKCSAFQGRIFQQLFLICPEIEIIFLILLYHLSDLAKSNLRGLQLILMIGKLVVGIRFTTTLQLYRVSKN